MMCVEDELNDIFSSFPSSVFLEIQKPLSPGQNKISSAQLVLSSSHLRIVISLHPSNEIIEIIDGHVTISCLRVHDKADMVCFRGHELLNRDTVSFGELQKMARATYATPQDDDEDRQY
jgi:hypothetical protein